MNYTGHWPIHIYWGQSLYHTDSISQVQLTLLHQIVFKILSLITGLRKLDHWLHTFISWGQSLCHTDALIIPNMMFLSNYLEDVKQNHWTMKYRSVTFYEVNFSVILIQYLKYDLHISNSLQDVRQNHWTMKYRSLWHTFILRSNVWHQSIK